MNHVSAFVYIRETMGSFASDYKFHVKFLFNQQTAMQWKVKMHESLRSPVRMEEMEVNSDNTLDVEETNSPGPLRRMNIYGLPVASCANQNAITILGSPVGRI